MGCVQGSHKKPATQVADGKRASTEGRVVLSEHADPAPTGDVEHSAANRHDGHDSQTAIVEQQCGVTREVASAALRDANGDLGDAVVSLIDQGMIDESKITVHIADAVADSVDSAWETIDPVSPAEALPDR